MNIELLTTSVILLVVLAVLLLLALWIFRQEKYRRMEAQKSSAELSLMREHIERNLYNLNDRLLSNEERWKDLNHLLLSYKPEIESDYARVKESITPDFFKQLGINQSKIKVQKNLVFVLTPFHQDKKQTFDAIVHACREVGLIALRGDEEFVQGDIFKFIVEKMLAARLIIANIDGRNPNVFYELGLAHAIGKPTIIVSKELSGVPFDLQSKHIILYKDIADLNYRLLYTFTRLLINE
ncbi:MAG: hypothetical protein HZB59_00755 [Ignavibacteriales bacterium]|nr:hypothetical protein [Ignavibacteriales bacterium]